MLSGTWNDRAVSLATYGSKSYPQSPISFVFGHIQAICRGLPVLERWVYSLACSPPV